MWPLPTAGPRPRRQLQFLLLLILLIVEFLLTLQFGLIVFKKILIVLLEIFIAAEGVIVHEILILVLILRGEDGEQAGAAPPRQSQPPLLVQVHTPTFLLPPRRTGAHHRKPHVQPRVPLRALPPRSVVPPASGENA